MGPRPVSVRRRGRRKSGAFDKSGKYVYQLQLPEFTTGDLAVKQPFEGLQDFAVDENSGTIYPANGEVWSASYECHRFHARAMPTANGTPVSEAPPPVATPGS